MTLDVIRAWEQAQSEPGKVSALESLLAVEENAVILASFIHERNERPEMLKLLDDVTLPKYLALPTDQRQFIDELRREDAKYLEGDFAVDAQINLAGPPRAWSERAIELYWEVHTRHAIGKIVECYIAHNPTSRRGPVPLTAWFQRYDLANGKNLNPQIKRKRMQKGNPAGNKYYQQYDSTKKGESFNDWVQAHLSESLNARLNQTPYFTQEKLTIEKVIEFYITHNPASQFGPVPLTAWFQSYNPASGEKLNPKVKGKIVRKGNPPANKYYQQYSNTKTKDSFDEWVESQLSAEVLERLQQTPYYVQEKMTVEQIVEQYIAHNPATRQGPMVLSSWFRQYDARTGENLLPQGKRKGERNGTPQGHKYYHQHIVLKGKQSFDDWVQSQLSDNLKSRLRATPYFKSKGDSP